MTTPSDKQTDNKPALHPPDRLIEIQLRYGGGANMNSRAMYEVRANDLAWLIQEVELSRAHVVDGVVATVDAANEAANKIVDYFNAPPSVIPAIEKIILRCAATNKDEKEELSND